MEIVKPRAFDKVTYRCKCKCGTKVDLDTHELYYGGGMYLKWICPLCNARNLVNMFTLQTKRIVHYKDIEE